MYTCTMIEGVGSSNNYLQLNMITDCWFLWGSCCSIFVFCVMFCRSLFVLSSFFFWPLCCLSFFDLLILITPLVTSNSSCTWIKIKYAYKYVINTITTTYYVQHYYLKHVLNLNPLTESFNMIGVNLNAGSLSSACTLK